MPFVLAILLSLAGATASAAPTAVARAFDAAPQSRGPTGVPMRRTFRYHDPAVEPAEFDAPAEATPLTTEAPPAAEPVTETTQLPEVASALPALAEAAPAADTRDRRKLGFSTAAKEPTATAFENPLNGLLAWRPSPGVSTAAGSGLAIVVGVFLLFAWVAKKSMPRSARALPSEAVEVLGRVRLAGKQSAQLLRVGRKLVLVNVTQGGAETLTEITDEAEVQRVLAACEQAGGRGSEAAFERLLEQMGGEATAPGFLGAEAPSYDAQRLAAAYANTPGGREHG